MALLTAPAVSAAVFYDERLDSAAAVAHFRCLKAGKSLDSMAISTCTYIQYVHLRL